MCDPNTHPQVISKLISRERGFSVSETLPPVPRGSDLEAYLAMLDNRSIKHTLYLTMGVYELIQSHKTLLYFQADGALASEKPAPNVPPKSDLEIFLAMLDRNGLEYSVDAQPRSGSVAVSILGKNSSRASATGKTTYADSH
jgi:hypothetical protein